MSRDNAGDLHASKAIKMCFINMRKAVNRIFDLQVSHFLCLNDGLRIDPIEKLELSAS